MNCKQEGGSELNNIDLHVYTRENKDTTNFNKVSLSTPVENYFIE